MSMNRTVMLALALLSPTCMPIEPSHARAKPPSTREARVALAEGSRSAWTRCAIAGLLNEHVAQCATCTSADDVTTCVLPEGTTIATQWGGREAGVFLFAEGMREPTRIARLEAVSEVSAMLFRGIDASDNPDACELVLTDEHLLIVRWTTGR